MVLGGDNGITWNAVDTEPHGPRDRSLADAGLHGFIAMPDRFDLP
jgi:hypothetical protein